MTTMRNRLVLSLLVLAVVPGTANGQNQAAFGSAGYVWEARVNVVSGEKIAFEEPRNLRVSGRAVATDEAVLLKTAIHSRLLALFPPGQSPQLHLGRERYPIFRQETENWDLKAERPVDRDRPHNRVEFLYFLIPASLAAEIPDGARATLKVNAPPVQAEAEGSGADVATTAGLISADPGDLPGAEMFDRDMVVEEP